MVNIHSGESKPYLKLTFQPDSGCTTLQQEDGVVTVVLTGTEAIKSFQKGMNIGAEHALTGVAPTQEELDEGV